MAEYLRQYLAPEWLAYVLAALVHAFLLVNLLALGAWSSSGSTQSLRPHSRSSRSHAHRWKIRLAANAGRRHQAGDQRRPHARRRRQDALSVGAVRQLLRVLSRLPGAAVCRQLGRRAPECRGLLRDRRAGPGSLRRDPGRLRLGLEVVAVRSHARSRPGSQLRSAAGHVRGRARADCRHHGPGDHRANAGRLVHQLVRVSRSLHVHHVLGVFHLCHGQRQSRPVRSGRSRERARGRISHRVFRLPLERVLSGRVWLDVRRQRTGRDSVFRRLERTVPDHRMAGIGGRLEPCAALPGQPGRLAQLHRQVCVRHHLHDVGPLDAAAAAHRPGDDHLLEILHPHRGRHVPRRGAMDVLRAGGLVLHNELGRVREAHMEIGSDPPAEPAAAAALPTTSTEVASTQAQGE